MMMAVVVSLSLLWSLVESNSQTFPYVSFMGQTLANHSYVDLSLVGIPKNGGDSAQCHTDLALNANIQELNAGDRSSFMASCCLVPVSLLVQLLWCVGNRKMQRYYKKMVFVISLFPALSRSCPPPPPPPTPILGNERYTRMVKQCIKPQWSQPMNNNLPLTPASVIVCIFFSYSLAVCFLLYVIILPPWRARMHSVYRACAQ